ncbi:MAG: glycosyltransferase [Candidatus Eisenbacteria bacterium]|jgi:glycosyltransferase involved in cell wall biosynthesis|nr:glycosyltransferase [Candidatus Eisenbacteria bacterium]
MRTDPVNAVDAHTRVLVLATTFPRWRDDTEPAFVYYLSQLLAERGFEITVLVPHAPGAALKERLGLLDVIRFPYAWPRSTQRVCYDGGALPNLKRHWRARLQLPGFLCAQEHAIAHLLRTRSWDLVHAHWIVPQGFFAAVHCRRRHVPLILTAHAGDVFAMNHFAVRPFGSYALRHAASCTVNSNATVEAVLKLHAGSKVNLVPMGVDLSLFHPGVPDEELIRRHDLRGRTVLGVGRFAEKKGFAHLVSAARVLADQSPDFRLLLVGFGPEEPALRKQTADLDLSSVVVFAGRVNQRDLARYYRACQAFALPSVVLPSGDTEGQGVVLLEAMSSSVPVVASAVGGITDIVTDGVNGLLVPPGNPPALAGALSRILDDPRPARQLAEQGLATIAARFSWDRIANRFAELYRRHTRTDAT